MDGVADGVDGDRIELRGLRTVAVVGVLPEERDRPQPLEIDLDLVVPLDAAGRSDALDDTVDYGEVCDRVVAVAGSLRPQLLEHLAGAVAEAVLELDRRIRTVHVAVRKVRPPVPHDLASSGVRLARSRT